VAPPIDVSSTGRRPYRSLNAPSTGEKMNCISAYSARITPYSTEISLDPVTSLSRLGRIGKMSPIPTESSVMMDRMTASRLFISKHTMGGRLGNLHVPTYC
jgi:hypothetical protein